MTDDTSSNHASPGITGWWSRLFQGRGEEIKGRDEIAAFLAECRRSELLAQDEYAMLQGVLEVSETHVRDIMVPRSHMVVLTKDDPPETLLHTIVESGHSRFPVIGEDRDEVLGILLAKDLLKHFGEGRRAFDIESLLRPAVFIPESKRLNTLL
ncbi:MAG TPA: CBS domain-containing protein, partial [Gammaproteobacteria bacterium]|nr:CBS domain-containing protein [Gammaproteobacteria bacterium]